MFTPPRQILEAVPGVQAEEMHRCKNRGFCCGAGGARMWMEERIGKRINTERIEEALALNPDTISTACPYCLVMLGDAVAAKKSSGEAAETLEVVDVAQLLARSVSTNHSVAASAPVNASGSVSADSQNGSPESSASTSWGTPSLPTSRWPTCRAPSWCPRVTSPCKATAAVTPTSPGWHKSRDWLTYRSTIPACQVVGHVGARVPDD